MLKVQYINGRTEDFPQEEKELQAFALKVAQEYNLEDGLVLYLEDIIVSFKFNKIAAIDLPEARSCELTVKSSLIPDLIRYAIDNDCSWELEHLAEVEDFFFDFPVRFIP